MFDVYMIKKKALLVGRPLGILDAKTAEKIVEFIELKETLEETGFHRFCDLTNLKGIRLSSVEVLKLADRRRAFNPNDIRVKSAFLATDPLALGIARMYQELLNSPRIKVRVFEDLQAAADWLEVKVDSLKH
ncbi:MAG TPA: hypothetical protein VMT15_15975 [Bryobacteraceae bacterium]|nr:hypothetical protein [Bryobacteraceae bacterium]